MFIATCFYSITLLFDSFNFTNCIKDLKLAFGSHSDLPLKDFRQRELFICGLNWFFPYAKVFDRLIVVFFFLEAHLGPSIFHSIYLLDKSLNFWVIFIDEIAFSAEIFFNAEGGKKYMCELDWLILVAALWLRSRCSLLIDAGTIKWLNDQNSIKVAFK